MWVFISVLRQCLRLLKLSSNSVHSQGQPWAHCLALPPESWDYQYTAPCMWFWGSDLGASECQASFLSAELNPQSGIGKFWLERYPSLCILYYYFNNKIILYNIYILLISYVANRKFAVKASIDSLYIAGDPITETFSSFRRSLWHLRGWSWRELCLSTRGQVSTGPWVLRHFLKFFFLLYTFLLFSFRIISCNM